MSLALLAQQREQRGAERGAVRVARPAASVHTAADHLLHHLRLLQVPSDGDCLFSSIAEVLARSDTEILASVNAAVLADVCPARVGARIAWAATMLRHIVAASVLRRDRVTDAALSAASEVARGGALPPAELEHFKLADASGTPPLSAAWRAALADAMRSRHTYWGDAYALYVLEALLRIRFVVLRTGGRDPARAPLSVLVTPDHGAEFVPLAYALLLLGGDAANHYTPLVVVPTRSLLFTRSTAPSALQAFLRADARADSPYMYLF